MSISTIQNNQYHLKRIGSEIHFGCEVFQARNLSLQTICKQLARLVPLLKTEIMAYRVFSFRDRQQHKNTLYRIFVLSDRSEVLWFLLAEKKFHGLINVFEPANEILELIASAGINGSGKPAHMRSFTRVFAYRTHKVWT